MSCQSQVRSNVTDFWAGPGFQAAPERRPGVPDLLRGDAGARGRRTPPVLHQRMCLLREEDRLPFGQESQSEPAAVEGAAAVIVGVSVWISQDRTV